MLDDRYISLLGNFDRIHPDTKIGKNVRIGEGTVIEKECEIGDNTLIGHNCVLRPRTKIGHDSMIGHLTVFEGDNKVGNDVVVHSQCHITSHTVIEDHVFVGPTVTFINTRNIKHGRNIPLVLDAAVIRYGARIGAKSIILPGVEVGREAVVGAGSVITKDCKPFGMYIGPAAKFVKEVPIEERL